MYMHVCPSISAKLIAAQFLRDLTFGPEGVGIITPLISYIVSQVYLPPKVFFLL